MSSFVIKWNDTLFCVIQVDNLLIWILKWLKHKLNIFHMRGAEWTIHITTPRKRVVKCRIARWILQNVASCAQIVCKRTSFPSTTHHLVAAVCRVDCKWSLSVKQLTVCFCFFQRISRQGYTNVIVNQENQSDGECLKYFCETINVKLSLRLRRGYFFGVCRLPNGTPALRWSTRVESPNPANTPYIYIHIQNIMK